MKNKIEGTLLHFAQIIIYTFVGIALISSILFLCGITIMWWTLPCIFALVGVSMFLVEKNQSEKFRVLLEVITICIVFIFSTKIIGIFYDRSWDGNAYHKLAIGLLKNGWNPVKEMPLLEKVVGAESDGNTIWCEGYCKVTWLFSAAVYALTDNIENGKVYTLLIMFCAFCFSLYYFSIKQVGIYKAIVISVCIACNPIAIQQMFTFYVDGFLQIVLEILILSLLMYSEADVFDKRISASMIFSSMIICGNVKFTGLLYGGLFCFVYFLYHCIETYKKKTDSFQIYVMEFLFFVNVAFFSFFVAGFSPYITNIKRHNTVIYPLSGGYKDYIMSLNSPFEYENHFTNLFISLFSRMENFSISAGLKPSLKVPFSIDWEVEKISLKSPDCRISGFGMLFSGVLVIAIISIIIFSIVAKKKKYYPIVSINVLTCLILTFGIKESWWARYAPYIYIFVCIALIILLCSKIKLANFVGILAAMILVVNNFLPLIYVKDYYYFSKGIDQQLNIIKQGGEIEVYNGEFEGIYFNMKDKNIQFEINKSLSDREGVTTMSYRGTMWKSK